MSERERDRESERGGDAVRVNDRERERERERGSTKTFSKLLMCVARGSSKPGFMPRCKLFWC